MYLAVSMESISAVLLTEREKRQVPIYFEITKVLPVVTDKPIKQILTRPEKSGRVAKWATKLGEHDIEFRGRNSIKGQVLADFLAETPFVEGEDKETKKFETPNEE
ncbi:hypothetical protein Tco_0884219 [Tanacetum coccineum]